MSLCRPDYGLFHAAQTDDVPRLLLYKQKLNQIDIRPQFRSFNALLHAAYTDGVKAFSYLLPLFPNTKTTCDLTVKAPGISEFASYDLAANSSVLHLILLRNSARCLQVYLALCEEPEPNACGITALHIAATVSTEIGSTYLRAIRGNMSDQAFDGLNPVMTACYYGRFRFLAIIQHMMCEYKELNDREMQLEDGAKRLLNLLKMVSGVQAALKQVDENGNTAWDYARYDLQNEEIACSKQDKQMTVQVFEQILRELSLDFTIE